MKNLISHSGIDIDIDVNPKGAIELALRASLGCASKARAWAWADDVSDIVKLKYRCEKLTQSYTKQP